MQKQEAAVALISPSWGQEEAVQNTNLYMKLYMNLISTAIINSITWKCVCACARAETALVIDVKRSVVFSDVRLAFLKSAWQTLSIIPCI